MAEQTQATFSTLPQALDNNLSESHFINYISSGSDESDVSFNELKQRALGILHNLQQCQIKTGEQLIIHTANNEFFLDAFWAGLYGGIIPVPVASATNDEHRHKLLRIFNKLESAWLYTDRKSFDQLQAFCVTNNMHEDINLLSDRTVLIDDIDDISQTGQIHECQPDDIAFIQFSSGSTSEPKGVVLTHKNILTNIRAIIEAAHFTQEDSFFSWMPLTHDMGMIGYHLTPIVLQVNHSIMDTSVFVRRPLLWLIAASKKKSSILCSPNFGYKHFLKVYQSKGIEAIDLSSVRLIFNGAEPISLELCYQFLSAMEEHGLKSNTMYPVYGLAEASLAVSFPVPGSDIESITLKRNHLAVGDSIEIDDTDSMIFVMVGKPIRDCGVRITDMENKPLADSTIGKIQLKGDNITSGYYQADATNKELITDDGWLDTGDLGAFIDGQLIITGRLKDIIFINGLNLYSHDLENILHTLDELELGKVIATGARKAESSEDELVIFILHRGDIESFIPLVKQVKKTINEQTGVEVQAVVPVKRIPKTTSGKVQRHILNDEYINSVYNLTLDNIKQQLDASFGDTDRVNSGSLQDKILQMCKSVVTDKTINLNDNLFEIGISSLSLAEIHEQIDESFPDMVDIADLFDHPTVAELSRFIEQKKL